MTHPPIGIDLGTTFSGLAMINNAGQPEMVQNVDGETLTASAVFFEDDNTVLIGSLALRSQKKNPSRCATDFKRNMHDPDWGITINGKRYTAIDLSSLVLKKLKQDAEAVLGPLENAVITVPAYFDQVRKEATQLAAEQAGLNVLLLMKEPTAGGLAAICGGVRPGTHLVFDLGGGTFDVSIMEMQNEDSVHVKASDGDHELGGLNFDWELSKWADNKWSQENQGLHQITNTVFNDPDSPLTVVEATLMQNCEGAKREISSRQEADIICQFEGRSGIVSVTRDDFDSLMKPFVARCQMLVENCLDDAKLNASDIDEVILVGGSTRIPIFREMLKKMFGKDPITPVSADQAVARGAAIRAGIEHVKLGWSEGLSAVAEASLRSKDVSDITTSAYGTISLGVDRKLVNTIIIDKNTPVPCSKTESFYTVNFGQLAVDATVTEAPDSTFTDPESCQTILIAPFDLPGGRAPGCEIRVTYTFNQSDKLEVKYYDVDSGRSSDGDVDFGGPNTSGGSPVPKPGSGSGSPVNFDDLIIE